MEGLRASSPLACWFAGLVFWLLITPLVMFGQEMTGKVLSPDGDPLKGATVTLLGGLKRQAERDVIGTTRSGPDGNFVFPSAPAGTLLLIAENAPLAPGTLLLNSADSRFGLTLQLVPGAPAAGRVVCWADRSPVSGARVVFADLPAVQTDETGAFRFPALPLAGPDLLLGVFATGYVTQDVRLGPPTAERQTLHVALRQGVSLRAFVRDLVGNPVPHATVRGRLPTAVTYGNLERTIFEAVTDERGEALIKGLPYRSPVCVEVSGPGMVQAQSDVVMTGEDPDGEPARVAVTLAAGVNLQVQVVSGDGRPIPDPTAHILPLVEPLLDFGGGVESARTSGPIQDRRGNAQGFLLFTELPCSPMTLEVCADGYRTVLQVVHPGVREHEVRVVLDRDPNPPANAIPYAATLKDAFDRADATGRPVLFTMAMDGERANDWMATHHFRDREIVRVARELPVILTNVFGAGSAIPQPSGIPHGEKDGICTRYGHGPCRLHQAYEAYCVQNLIGEGVDFQVPRQFVVAPNGEILLDRSYYLSERDYLRMLLRALHQSDAKAAFELARDRLRPMLSGFMRADTTEEAISDFLLLLHSGDEHAAALTFGLKDVSVLASVRKSIAQGIEPRAAPSALEALKPLLLDEDAQVRAAAYANLQQRGSVDQVVEALESVGQPNCEFARAAMRALPARGTSEVSAHANDPDWPLRWTMLKLHMGEPLGSTTLASMAELAGGSVLLDSATRAEFFRDLAQAARQDGSARTALLAAMDGDAVTATLALEHARRWIPDALDQQDFRTGILRHLDHSSGELRRSAVCLLATSPGPGATERLSAMLTDPDENVRLEVATALLFRDHPDAAAVVGAILYGGAPPAHLLPRLRVLYQARSPKDGEDFLLWMRRLGLIVIDSGDSDHGQ